MVSPNSEANHHFSVTHRIPGDTQARVVLHPGRIPEASGAISEGWVVLDHDAVDLARSFRGDGPAGIAGARNHQPDKGSGKNLIRERVYRAPGSSLQCWLVQQRRFPAPFGVKTLKGEFRRLSALR